MSICMYIFCIIGHKISMAQNLYDKNLGRFVTNNSIAIMILKNTDICHILSLQKKKNQNT